MVKTFKCKETKKVWNREFSNKFSKNIQTKARRKLIILASASTLNDLRVPPSNRLEKLKGDRNGQYSIRINNQWRVCFYFNDGEATEVEIVDYH
ncbi:type II toxin-antitoxin system RelE/ParE family toxin [Desulforhopalus vacuolatus]|uniref:type II toxin-antitoxin system RelE/ParE family toxin n=1 Tax=Desulforhopalus vacuolatus TaxID=40414 RepID=UPI001965723A|nr:type II toxin-antitoxin system RelE/ParE family toxin [Desulforhopalus vacuolatus]MBM9520965.1 type II toxin-antitoxin system RelE/ParE family toxin [Desulforhopalus vacuolatus]